MFHLSAGSVLLYLIWCDQLLSYTLIICLSHLSSAIVDMHFHIFMRSVQIKQISHYFVLSLLFSALLLTCMISQEVCNNVIYFISHVSFCCGNKVDQSNRW